MLIFNRSRAGRSTGAHLAPEVPVDDLPRELLREGEPPLPQVSELQVVRHYTRLSQKNFSIDTHFYPLGSCTMKYNPKVCGQLATLPGFLTRHPERPARFSQGFLACLFELQQMLAEITGMREVALSPLAGAQGELAGMLMFRAYHQARDDHERREVLVPDAAHGTNPASAVMAGFQVREIPTDDEGDVELEALRRAVGPHTAGIMLTNPSTLGVFERRIAEINRIVHDAGGLSYYDGANLNAILGRVRPGEMGFDVMHINLHKTFATPHGGGGPGAGPVAAGERLAPFLPLPMVQQTERGYDWLEERHRPQSIGRLTTWAGNAAVLLRAWVYLRILGAEGLKRVADHAVLNANYLLALLKERGFTPAFPGRRATHEFLITLKPELEQTGVNARDFAKRLLDFGFHAPTTYFPLLVPECFLIEPTETESREELDAFAEAMHLIRKEAQHNPEKIRTAPHTLPVRRVDEVRAAREPDLAWRNH